MRSNGGEAHRDVEDAIALASRVAASLGHAHALGIVHRDVKPSNIFRHHGRAAEATLVDFGALA